MALTMGDVGLLDTVYDSILLTNSGNAEEAWVKNLFGDEYYIKYDTVAADWTKVDGTTDWYALALQDEPEYFFIKLGIGGTNIPVTHLMYTNNDEKSYAVVALSQWGATTGSINIGRVSHVGEIGVSVPEPSTVLLLGFGLVGLAGLGRKKLKH